MRGAQREEIREPTCLPSPPTFPALIAPAGERPSMRSLEFGGQQPQPAYTPTTGRLRNPWPGTRLLDFGPQFDAGILTVMPPVVSAPYKVYVPKTDSDGNDIGGIRTPDVAVPLATYTGWALRAEKEPQNADGCDASGQKLPFAATKFARLAAGDPRPSLAERYKDHATYVRLVTEAARRLQRERLLVEPDAEAYITAAETAAVP